MCLAGLVMCFDKVVHERVVAGDPAHILHPALTNSFIEGHYGRSLLEVMGNEEPGDLLLER